MVPAGYLTTTLALLACGALRGEGTGSVVLTEPTEPVGPVETDASSLDELRTEVVAAMGGRSALAAVVSERAEYTAVVTGADGVQTDATLFERSRPEAGRVDLAIGGTSFSVLCRGPEADMIVGTQTLPLQGVAAVEALRSAYDTPLALVHRWLNGAPARLLPPRQESAHILDAVEIEDPAAGPVELDVDSTTHLPVALTFKDDLGVERVELSDWRGEGALLVPHHRLSLRADAGGGGLERMDSTLVSFAVNESEPEWAFAEVGPARAAASRQP
jgi:hypothetical protein